MGKLRHREFSSLHEITQPRHSGSRIQSQEDWLRICALSRCSRLVHGDEGKQWGWLSMLQEFRDGRGLPGSGGFELDLKVDISGNKEGRHS